ncbi:MAG: NUDIX domain-containing protein [Bacilli bacterium]|nr:NUDIX domain-containing protein [Bacilli bacterium]
MEIMDLYDENKKLTNQTIEKGKLIPKGFYYLTVVVWIQNSKKELLLQVNKKYNMWSTTGGHPISGQTSLKGIVTEIKEELGIDVEENNLKLFKTIKTEDDFVDIYYLKMDVELENITTQEEEVGSIKWASIEEINMMIKKEIFLLPHIKFFNYLLEYLNRL